MDDLRQEYRRQMAQLGPSEAQIQAVLDRLEGKKARPRRPAGRALIAAAVAAALCAGGAAAISGTLTARPGGFSARSEAIPAQPYSTVVGASASDHGYTLTVDGVGIDEAFLTIYATITSEAPIPDGIGGLPAVTRWLSLRAEGEELLFWPAAAELTRVDSRTVTLVQRCPVTRELPDVVSLEVYTTSILSVYGIVPPGDWTVRLEVDKSAPDSRSLAAEPHQIVDCGGYQVAVEKVAVAPSGGLLVLSDAGQEESEPFVPGFLLLDDRGEPLPLRGGAWISGGETPTAYEFYGGRPDMASLTIVPWYASESWHAVSGPAGALPLSDPEAEHGFALVSLDIGPDQAVGVFQGFGLLAYAKSYTPAFRFLDAGGQEISLHSAPIPYSTDWDPESGRLTVTCRYPGAPAEQVARIAQVCFPQFDSFTIREDAAVTIPLSPP